MTIFQSWQAWGTSNLEYYVQSTNRYDEGGGDDIHESTSFQASQQHVLSLKMAYNIEYHDSYAWIDTTPDDYTNEGGFESSHYTTNNDTDEEGFESSSSYSSISCLSPIDAASAKKYCCMSAKNMILAFLIPSPVFVLHLQKTNLMMSTQWVTRALVVH